MQSSREDSSHDLLIHLFYLITEKHAHDVKQWCLIDEISPEFLTDGTLHLHDIDFSLFGYKISHINFRDCHFTHCVFSNQIFINCNFSISSLLFSEFINFAMDKATKENMSRVMLYEINKRHHTEVAFHGDDISDHAMRQICYQWAMHFSPSPPGDGKLIRFYSSQINAFNKRYNDILFNSIKGFFRLSIPNKFIPQKISAEWKLHLSVKKDSVKQAYDCIADLLLDKADKLSFKVIDIAVPANKRNPRYIHAAQFTIYPFHHYLQPLIDKNELIKLLEEIVGRLQSMKIPEGEIPESDRKTNFPYFSMRNDGNYVIKYISASNSGRNYNPYHFPPIFDYLLPKNNEIFDIETHFKSFNIDTDEKIAIAFHATLFAIINEYIKPEFIYKLHMDENFKYLFYTSIYPDYSFILQDDISLIMKENVDESDLFTMKFLLKKCAYYKIHDSSFAGSAAAIIKFFESAMFPDHAACNSTFFCSYRQSILQSKENSLLKKILNLVSFVPKNFHDKSLNYLITASPWSSHSKDECDLSSLLKQINLSMEQWITLSREKQILLSSPLNINHTIKFFQFPLTFNQIINMRLDIFCGLVTRPVSIESFCQSAKLSLDNFLSYDSKFVMMILIYPERTTALLNFFDIDLEKLSAVPIGKCIMLLKHHIDKYEKNSSCSFAKLIQFDDEFINKLFTHKLLSDKQYNEEMITALSHQKSHIQEFWLENARYIPLLFHKKMTDLGSLYDLSKNFIHLSDLVSSVSIQKKTEGEDHLPGVNACRKI